MVDEKGGRKLRPKDLPIPQYLTKRELMDDRFDCDGCSSHCIRRRICCNGNGECRLQDMIDGKIIFWCGTQNKYVTRNRFCLFFCTAKPKIFDQFGLRSNVDVYETDGEVANFDKHGETCFEWYMYK